jgi:Sec-independent protein translocase protein TatA
MGCWEIAILVLVVLLLFPRPFLRIVKKTFRLARGRSKRG